jgi:hypothetical protein
MSRASGCHSIMKMDQLQLCNWLSPISGAQSAASSNLGNLVLQLAQIFKFKMINVVRRRDQVGKITEFGGDLELRSITASFSLCS